MMNMFQYYKSLILYGILVKSFGAIQNSYLDKMVAYYKESLFEDLRDLPINIKVSLERAPPNYKDDTSWNSTSVLRLLSIIRNSADTPPALRRMASELTIQQNRRFYYKFSNKFRFIPSLSHHILNNIYYDLQDDIGNFPDVSLDIAPKTIFPKDDDIIVINNPVEARLPSAQISVRCMKDILEARAVNARYIPTTKKEYTWLSTKNNNLSSTTNITNTTNIATANITTSAPLTTVPNLTTITEKSARKYKS